MKGYCSMKEKHQELLSKQWSDEEKELLERLMNSLSSCRYLMPKYLKADIMSAINLCIKLKDQLDSE